MTHLHRIESLISSLGFSQDDINSSEELDPARELELFIRETEEQRPDPTPIEKES
jgi:hypothetical protein